MSYENLLFINKSSKSFSSTYSKSEADEISKINAHVHKYAIRKARQPIAASASRLVGWRGRNAQHKPLSLSFVETKRHGEDHCLDSPSTSFYSNNSSVSLSPPPDSVGSSMKKITSNERSLLQYFVSVWMPSDTRRTGHQLTGFSPVSPDDGKLCHSIVRGALQSVDTMALNSLLTVVSQRIRLLNHAPPDPASSPEQFSLRAIQALRESISSAQRPLPRVILDLSYMILADLYRPPPTRSIIFRRMNRDLIIGIGGLHKLNPFIAQAALAYEYFTAQSEVSIPVLDPIRDRRLLGVAEEAPESEAKKLAASRILKLELRNQVLSEDLHYLAQLAEALQQFPPLVVDRTTTFTRRSTVQHHQLNAAALQQCPINPNLQSVTIQSTIMSADGLWMHLRQQAHRVWLWYSAFAFYVPAGESLDLEPIATPDFITRDASRFADILSRIDNMLVDTGWMMRKDLVFWISSLGVLVGETDAARYSCSRWLTKTANELNITNENALCKIISIHLPFTQIRVNACEELWRIIRDDREWWAS